MDSRSRMMEMFAFLCSVVGAWIILGVIGFIDLAVDLSIVLSWKALGIISTIHLALAQTAERFGLQRVSSTLSLYSLSAHQQWESLAHQALSVIGRYSSNTPW